MKYFSKGSSNVCFINFAKEGFIQKFMLKFFGNYSNDSLRYPSQDSLSSQKPFTDSFFNTFKDRDEKYLQEFHQKFISRFHREFL